MMTAPRPPRRGGRKDREGARRFVLKRLRVSAAKGKTLAAQVAAAGDASPKLLSTFVDGAVVGAVAYSLLPRQVVVTTTVPQYQTVVDPNSPTGYGLVTLTYRGKYFHHLEVDYPMQIVGYYMNLMALVINMPPSDPLSAIVTGGMGYAVKGIWDLLGGRGYGTFDSTGMIISPYYGNNPGYTGFHDGQQVNIEPWLWKRTLVRLGVGFAIGAFVLLLLKRGLTPR